MNLRFYSVKLLAIAYASLFHVAISLFCSRVIDKLMPDIELDPETHLEHRGRTLAIIAMNIIILTVVAYAIRNVGELIPFPLDGYNGYNHSMLKERTSTVISGFLLMYYQTKLRKRFDMLLLY